MAAKLIEAAGALQMAVRAAEVSTYLLFGYLRSLETAYRRTSIYIYMCVYVKGLIGTYNVRTFCNMPQWYVGICKA